MFTDLRIRTAATAMLDGVKVPTVPLAEIAQRIARPASVARPWSRYRVAAAAAVVVLATIPAIAPALVQSLEAQYRAALQALGGVVPPPAPASFVAQLAPQLATLALAQARVNFTIVPPAGLPADAAPSSIHVGPIGVYTKETHVWRVAAAGVTFAYRRSDGRELVLIAKRYDPNDLLARYIFEAKGPAADGRPVLVKHERFAWRNGDQLMTAIADSDMSAAEIAAIQSAMHGTSVPRRNAQIPGGGDLFFRPVPKP